MPELSIVQLLLGAGTEVALEREFDRALKLIPGFRQRDQLGRLLALLHDEYGARAGLFLEDCDCWRDDLDLSATLEAVVQGRSHATASSDLASLLEPRLENVVSAQDLALQLAAAAVELAPVVQREIGESTSFLSNRLQASEDLLSRQGQQATDRVLAALTTAAQNKDPG